MPRWLDALRKAAPAGAPAGTTSSDLRAAARMMGESIDRKPGDVIQFGPGEVPAPSPLGADPRQWQYRPGWNLPSVPGEGRPVSYATIWAVSRNFSVMRKCIEIRKDQVSTMTFDLKARDSDKRRSRQVMEAQKDDIQRVREFFRKPDRKHTFRWWIENVMEQHLLYDGVSTYKRRTLDPDTGPTSAVTGHPMGGIWGLELKDTPTIKPLLDSMGMTPDPPAPAYQQYLYGVPRFDFTTDEFIYAVKSPSLNSPYGFSHVEQFLDMVNLNLRYWSSMTAVYTDGTIPEGVAVAPPGWTMPQLEEYTQWWNSVLAGDPKALRKLMWVPNGVDFHLFQEHNFDEPFARFLTDLCIAQFDLTPIEYGLEPSHGGLGGKGLGETVTEVAQRRGVRPFCRFILDELINPIIWDEFGLLDLEGTFSELDNEEEQERSTAINLAIRNATLSIDDVIEEEGGEPIGVGHIYETSNGVVLFERDLVLGAQEGAAALGLITSPEQRQQQAQAQAEALAARTQNGNSGNSNQNPQQGDGPAAHSQTQPAETGRDASGSGSPSTADKVADVRRWESKVLRALKGGKNPAEVRFDTVALPEAAQAQVRSLLDGADVMTARQVFRDTRLALEAAAAEIDAQMAVRGL